MRQLPRLVVDCRWGKHRRESHVSGDRVSRYLEDSAAPAPGIRGELQHPIRGRVLRARQTSAQARVVEGFAARHPLPAEGADNIYTLK